MLAGVYQQLVAHAYTSAFKAAPSTSSSTPLGAGAAQASSTQAPVQQQQQQQLHAGGARGGLLSTAEIMVIQTGSSMLAGATSSLITNPLDLIKTRIQVAHRHEGQPATFRSVITEIVAEDGPFGLFRGVLPRMVNAALWGTCMVTVYEFLRRASRKEPDQE
ncbi:mitochondrial carrier protein-domain-containing protein [Dunaliella salina]|uniref:Mitochondrial carrier protein-domain-containing protein n=1 Tax=Dunaliella salina TaxID=3046 RepID=A0ABQ7G6M3_DUNSA|nr:mitochondrial carrier protein-domain-containing protein [Dunaliella salina]|eukprot:KAF5830215.1 mitochondrial carrier protein-domain-containing protein [Dunaliella salina]